MKYTRVDLKKGLGMDFKIIFRLFILIPVLAIIIGGAVAQYIVVPYLSKNNIQTTPINKGVEKSKFYFVQAGVFAKPANAEFVATTLKGLEYPAKIVDLDEEYWVIVGVSDDNDYIDGIVSKIQESGFSCIKRKIDVTEVSVEDANYKKYLEVVSSIFSQEIKISKKPDEEGLRTNLETSVNELKDYYDKLDNNNENYKIIEAFHKIFLEDLGKLKQNLQEDILERQALMINKLYKSIIKGEK